MFKQSLINPNCFDRRKKRYLQHSNETRRVSRHTGTRKPRRLPVDRDFFNCLPSSFELISMSICELLFLSRKVWFNNLHLPGQDNLVFFFSPGVTRDAFQSNARRGNKFANIELSASIRPDRPLRALQYLGRLSEGKTTRLHVCLTRCVCVCVCVPDDSKGL